MGQPPWLCRVQSRQQQNHDDFLESLPMMMTTTTTTAPICPVDSQLLELAHQEIALATSVGGARAK